MCALNINIRYLLSLLSNHMVEIKELCSYSHIIRQFEIRYNDRLMIALVDIELPTCYINSSNVK